MTDRDETHGDEVPIYQPVKVPEPGFSAFGPAQPTEEFDTQLNACVAYVTKQRRDMSALADGFRQSAEAMFPTIGTVGRSADVMLFPLAFAWRHYVELCLKEIIALGRELHGEEPKFPEHHKIADLWHIARPYVEETGPQGEPQPDPTVLATEANIMEVATIDPDSYAFRYLTKKRSKALQLENAPTHINLGQFHDRMLRVAAVLFGVRCTLNRRLGNDPLMQLMEHAFTHVLRETDAGVEVLMDRSGQLEGQTVKPEEFWKLANPRTRTTSRSVSTLRMKRPRKKLRTGRASAPIMLDQDWSQFRVQPLMCTARSSCRKFRSTSTHRMRGLVRRYRNVARR